MGYSFYYSPKNKVFVAQNAEFFENSLITQEASGSLEDLEIIQEEDTYPSIDTSLHHDEDDQEIDEPQSDIILIRDLDEPANYKAVLLDPESNKWLNAMNVEMQSMKDNKVWELVDLPSNGKTIGHKWLFKKKTDMDGAVHTYKARLVAKGFTQTPDIRAIRILIAITAFYDYEICKVFFSTSSTNAEYITAFDASKEAVWIQKFIYGLGVVPTIEEPINMYCDNTGAISIAKDHGVTKGARNFRSKVHYLCKTIEMGDALGLDTHNIHGSMSYLLGFDNQLTNYHYEYAADMDIVWFMRIRRESCGLGFDTFTNTWKMVCVLLKEDAPPDKPHMVKPYLLIAVCIGWPAILTSKPKMVEDRYQVVDLNGEVRYVCTRTMEVWLLNRKKEWVPHYQFKEEIVPHGHIDDYSMGHGLGYGSGHGSVPINDDEEDDSPVEDVSPVKPKNPSRRATKDKKDEP
ncbi:retrotransposon protein, putative, ty1-copia subclass [Tanacetum coccineum]